MNVSLGTFKKTVSCAALYHLSRRLEKSGAAEYAAEVYDFLWFQDLLSEPEEIDPRIYSEIEQDVQNCEDVDSDAALSWLRVSQLWNDVSTQMLFYTVWSDRPHCHIRVMRDSRIVKDPNQPNKWRTTKQCTESPIFESRSGTICRMSARRLVLLGLGLKLTQALAKGWDRFLVSLEIVWFTQALLRYQGLF